MRSRSRLVAHAFALGLTGFSLLGALGCGDDPDESAPKPTIASAPASASASASAPAAPPKAPHATSTVEIPSGDAKLTPALEALAGCEGVPSGGRGTGCDALDAWEAHMLSLRRDKRRFPDQPPRRVGRNAPIDDRTRTSASCVASLRHTSPKVRRAAYDCLADLSDGGLDPALAVRVLLEQFALESDPTMRRAAAGAIRSVDPAKHGVVPEVLALARTLLGRPSREDDLGMLVEALIPRKQRSNGAPAREAFEFALELSKRREASPAVTELLGRAIDRADEACETLVAIAEGKRGSWSKAVAAIGEQGARCKAQHPRVVRLLGEFAQGKTGPGRERYSATAVNDIERFVRSSGLEPKLKAELYIAVRSAPTDDERSMYAQQMRKLLEALR